MKNPSDYIAIALDNLEELGRIKDLINQTKPFCAVYKVGLELFTRYGPSVLDCIHEADRAVFLDLKFHDIPNTVAKAVTAASQLGVQYCTVHTQGGKAMMSAAVAAARASRNKGIIPPKLIGVTVLTSIDANCLRDELNVGLSVERQVQSLAGLAVAVGMDGIVCSAADLPKVKKTLPETFEIITPGIRSSGNAVHDQKRVATPAEAVANGATLLVIGREVTQAADPVAAAQAILSDISSLNT
jgi:orotidine 5''-phosphate decarboxylase, subfamily 1